MIRLSTIATAAALSAALSGQLASAQEPFFEGLGYLRQPFSFARGISGDGRVAVGFSDFEANDSFRWKSGRMFSLGIEGANDAWGVSGDGNVIVGRMRSAPYRWEDGQAIDLGDLPGGRDSGGALGVSRDGRVVVGWSYSDDGREAFRWTRESGMVGLGDLPGGQFGSTAWDASADGSVIVGQGTAGNEKAFRWEDGKMSDLGVLPGQTGSLAFAVSADGSVVAGWSFDQSTGEPFRWEKGEMIALGVLPGMEDARAFGISADGSVVVGAAFLDDVQSKPFVWDASHGLRDLRDVFKEVGLDLEGWTNLRADDVADDGLTFVGSGRNPRGDIEGWIAYVPEPSTLLLLVFVVCVVRRQRV